MRDIEIRVIDFETGEPLRLNVLRPPAPNERGRLEQFRDPRALHFGAYRDGALVGVATLVPRDQVGGETPGHFRLRGMAVDEAVRGRGVGSDLLSACLRVVRGHGAALVWCDGRTRAAPFYERLGFERQGEEFVTATGPHFRFFLDFAAWSDPSDSRQSATISGG